jgi:putative flippase GtrA
VRRAAVVGALVTAFDVAVLYFARSVLGTPLLWADVVAVSGAATLSYDLHSRYTYAGEPRNRLRREPGPFVRVAFAGGVIDVAVFLSLATVWPLLAAKLVAVGLAASFRVTLYRRLLHARVRTDQARRTDRPPASGDVRFSVVIPAYKEGPRMAGTVRTLRESLTGVETEIVVVDDGSGDDTADAARAAGADRVIVQPRNRGKGAAVRAGMLAARGRTIAFTDADLAYPPAQLKTLLAEVESGWDVVVGSRRHVDTTTLVRGRRLRELSGRLFNLFTLLVLLGQYRDTQCGLKAFRSDVAQRVFGASRVDGFAFDVEVFHLAERFRLSLKEVPVELANTDTSTVRVGVEAVRMVRDLMRIRRLGATGVYEEPHH